AGSYVILVYPLKEQSGGNLTVNASDSVLLEKNTLLFTQSFLTGNSGNINVTTKKLVVRDGAQMQGQLTINASDSVELIGGSPIPVLADG
ncbi:MAG: filamentous hemagglutinin N-terminal domain-containing protein, partial [Nostoc sp.]